MTEDSDLPNAAPGASEAAVDRPVEGSPSDNTTLVAVLNTWKERGFGGQFVGSTDGQIECITCGAVSDASRFEVTEWRRLEGASDPDDMVKAVAARCPACGSGGNLVLGYGVNASELDAEISAALGTTDPQGADTPVYSTSDITPPTTGSKPQASM
jgi:hypothetical protein